MGAPTHGLLISVPSEWIAVQQRMQRCNAATPSWKMIITITILVLTYADSLSGLTWQCWCCVYDVSTVYLCQWINQSKVRFVSNTLSKCSHDISGEKFHTFENMSSVSAQASLRFKNERKKPCIHSLFTGSFVTKKNNKENVVQKVVAIS